MRIVVGVCLLILAVCTAAFADSIKVTFGIIDEAGSLRPDQLSRLLSLISCYQSVTGYYLKVRVVNYFDGRSPLIQSETIYVIIEMETRNAHIFRPEDIDERVVEAQRYFERIMQNECLYVVLRDGLLKLMGCLAPDSELPVGLISSLMD